MNSASHHWLACCASACLATFAAAQEEPPPWWGVQDDVTVSLHWNFDNAFTSWPPPDFARVPTWYQPLVTTGVLSPNVVHITTVPGQTGVLGMLGTGSAQSGSLDLTIDNNPHLDWIKIFWFQFDVLEGASGSVVAELEKSLQYERANISQKSRPLGNGWERVTVSAKLIPQPNDEGIDWNFVENAFGTVAIDNLYVNSKCVKPGPDETGDATGDVDAGTLVDVTQVGGGLDITGVTVTEGPAPAFARRYWVGTRATLPGQSHAVLRLDGAIVTSTILTGVSPTVAPQGVGDLATETKLDWIAPGQPPVILEQWVYAIVDRRVGGQPPALFRIDALGVVPTSQIPLLGFPAPAAVSTQQDFGLAFDPTGDQGVGTFWVSFTDNSNAGHMIEYSRTGVPRGTENAPAGCTGLGYDATLGNFYGFSSASRPSPNGPVEVNGFEWSGYDFQDTGTRFCGNLSLPNPGGPRGGTAAGLEVYRRIAPPPFARAPLTIVCLAKTPNAGTVNGRVWLYEIAAPFGFGYSVLGRCGMRNGPPFLGTPNFEVTLTGVPNSLFAMLFLGFSNTVSSIGPLPIPLTGPLGWQESILSIDPAVSSALMAPSAPGEFALQFAIPPAATLGYAPVFFQWLALDTSIQGGFAMSQAGKTVLYP